MVIVMNVDLMDQKKAEGRRMQAREEAGLFRCLGVVGFSRGRMIRWKRDYFFASAFPLVHKGVVLYKKAGRSLDTRH